MRPTKYLLLLIPIFILSCQAPTKEADQTTEGTSGKEFYELKVYTFDNDDQVAITDDFLGSAFIPAMKRQGISPIGVFKNRINEEDTVQKIYVLIPFKTMDQFLSYEDKLIADDTFLDAGKGYIDAPHDNPPYARIASSLVEAFDDMPAMATPDLEGPRSERIYELRSYLGPSEKLHLNKVAMFNDGEVDIFDRLGFNAVFYGRVLVGDEMPNLVYMTTFSDMKSRDEHWDAFRADPQWMELKSVDKYQNNMLKSKVYLLYPTDYSAY
ncbi:MAG: NIPSNAP family protein [Cyclobacteriaceae bacterium]